MGRPTMPPPLQPLLFQMAETPAGFSFASVLDEARAVWFPELEDEVEVRIGAYGPLAFVVPHHMGRRRHVVVFHPVLNQPGVPVEAVRFIAKHELAHLLHPPVARPWGREWHHEEFWQHEHAVAPERWAVWRWIFDNLGKVLRRTPRGIAVMGSWRRRLGEPHFTPYTPGLPFEAIPWRELCPEGGAQLRLPPEWAWRPVLAADSGPLSPFAVPLST